MPRRRTRGEDIAWRAIIVIILAVITGGWGLLIGVFLFWPYIRALLRELSSPPRPPAPEVPNLPGVISRGISLRTPESLREGEEASLRVGFRNLWNRTMTVEIKLDDLGRVGDVRPASFFLTLKPGEYAERIVRFIPRRKGEFKVSVTGRVGVFLGRREVVLRVDRKKTGAADTVGTTEVMEVTEAGTIATYGSAGEGHGSLQDLLSRYRDVSLIGEGGFARVYRARRKDGTLVALKVPKSLDEESGRVFLREASAWLGLRHRNIVELYDANVFPIPYIEMEYCPGNLGRLKKPLSWEDTARLTFEVAEGLKYAHSRGVIHRDLKPSNILLKDGTPKISDWGLCKLSSMSMSSVSFTPYYAAPEQISRSRFGHSDERTDIWQLGVLMYELTTGKVPFEGDDFVEIAEKITMEEPKRPSEINPDSQSLEPVIMKCLSKRKEERYQSVKELQRDLADLLGGRYKEELRRSVDFSRSAYYAGQLLLLHLKLGDAKEALKYALDLKRYARGEARMELEGLVRQLEVRVSEGLPIPPELVEKAEVVVHEVSGA